MYNTARDANKIKTTVSLDSVCIEKSLTRVDGDVVVKEGSKVDYQKEIDSQIKNAGLQTILKMQTMRYGTLENAKARNAARMVFADVSSIPDSVGAQQEFVKKQTEELDAYAKKLGVSRSELLAMTESTFNAKMEALRQASGGSNDGKEE